MDHKTIIFFLWAPLVGPALGQMESGAAARGSPGEFKCAGMTASEYQRWAARNPAGAGDASFSNPMQAACEQSGDRPHAITRTQPQDNSISYTTLAAPKTARKAYENARKELHRSDANHAKAVQQLEKAVTLYPRFAQAWNLLGETLRMLGRRTEARQAFEQALAADPQYTAPYLSLAFLDLMDHRPVEAALLIDRVLGLNPHLTEARLYQAILAYGSGRAEFAKQVLRTLLEDEPRARPVLGGMLSEEGDFHSAAVQYREFLKLHPTSRTAVRLRRELAEWHEKGLIE